MLRSDYRYIAWQLLVLGRTIRPMNTPRQFVTPSASMLSRVISIVVLVALVVLFGAMFYQVMAEFLVPLFLAMLLTVLASPLFEWLLPRCKNSPRWASLATVFLILAMILIPTVLLSIRAVREAENLFPHADDTSFAKSAAAGVTSGTAEKLAASPAVEELASNPPTLNTLESQKFHDLVVRGVTWINEHTGLSLKPDEVQTKIVSRAKTWLQDLAIKTPTRVISFLFGLTIMLIAVYYFLIDGHAMIESIGKLLPLAGDHQRTLLRDFVDVSRAVAAATLLGRCARDCWRGLAITLRCPLSGFAHVYYCFGIFGAIYRRGNHLGSRVFVAVLVQGWRHTSRDLVSCILHCRGLDGR